MTYQGQDWLNAWLLGGGSSPTRGALGLRPEVPIGLWPTGARKHSKPCKMRSVAWVGGRVASASQHPRIFQWT
jgi:hypothetical protein